MSTYWRYFNLLRPNRGKEWQSPWQILQARSSPSRTLLHWRTLNLAQRHHAYFAFPLQKRSRSTRLSLEEKLDTS